MRKTMRRPSETILVQAGGDLQSSQWPPGEAGLAQLHRLPRLGEGRRTTAVPKAIISSIVALISVESNRTLRTALASIARA